MYISCPHHKLYIQNVHNIFRCIYGFYVNTKCNFTYTHCKHSCVTTCVLNNNCFHTMYYLSNTIIALNKNTVFNIYIKCFTLQMMLLCCSLNKNTLQFCFSVCFFILLMQHTHLSKCNYDDVNTHVAIHMCVNPTYMYS